MLGTSTALTTASSSTSHISAILRLFDSVTGRSLRSTSASGWMPIERRVATECCVGLVFCSPDAPMNGTSETWTKKTFGAAELVADLPGRLDERLRLDVADRAADLGDDHVGLRRLVGLQAHAPLDLVGDVRDDLHGVAEVLAATLARDHLRVDLAGGDVRRLAQLDVEEALVVADVEVGLGAVVGHEDLAVLERVHRPRIDVQIGVELLHDHPQAPRREQVAQAGRRQSLAQRRNDTAGHEDVPSGAVLIVRRMSFRHGLLSYQSDWARRPSSSRAWVSAASESGIPESSLAISASRSAPSRAPHIGRRDRSVAGLHDRQVVVRECRDLREMGDRDDLRRAGQARQAPADLDRGGAADAGIHLVEHERRNRIDRGDHDLDREHDAAELAARRALGDRARFGAGVRGEQDRDVVAAARRLGARA